MSKRRKGFPSETHVKRGYRVIKDKELLEKLGRNDPCPCGSNRCFQEVLSQDRLLLTARTETITRDSFFGPKGMNSLFRRAAGTTRPLGPFISR